MKFFGPPGKLDGRIFYTIEEARLYLMGLSSEARSNYIIGELLDFWFLVNYTWLSFLGFQYFHPGSRLRMIPVFGGVLDFFETSLILLYLLQGNFLFVHEWLPFLSTPKWFIALGCMSYLLIKKWRTASH